MQQFSYKTIKKPVSEILLKENGSKFLGFAASISSDEDFKNYLAEIKKLHPKATHHCYAFRLGIDGNNFRANDDGEPNGSAGLPIYNQILAKELTNICVIIVRYYGGTKLGVAGLVKAYKTCTLETLENAILITEDLKIRLKIGFKFEKQNEVFTLINKFSGKILEFDAAENCVIFTEINLISKNNLTEKFSEMHGISFEEIEN